MLIALVQSDGIQCKETNQSFFIRRNLIYKDCGSLLEMCDKVADSIPISKYVTLFGGRDQWFVNRLIGKLESIMQWSFIS